MNARAQSPSRAPNTERGPRAVQRTVLLVLRSGALIGTAFVLLNYPYAPGSVGARLIDGALALEGRGAAALLRLVDPSAAYVAGSIASPFPLQIVKACGAFDAHAMLAGAVLAYGAPVRAKLLALVLGTAALALANTLRMAALSLIGAHAPGLFDVVHEELFPLGLVAVALASFALFLRLAASAAESSEARAAR